VRGLEIVFGSDASSTGSRRGSQRETSPEAPRRRPYLGLKWTPKTGPLDRGVFVKALPYFNRG
jgi:hypothetical protein